MSNDVDPDETAHYEKTLLQKGDKTVLTELPLLEVYLFPLIIMLNDFSTSEETTLISAYRGLY